MIAAINTERVRIISIYYNITIGNEHNIWRFVTHDRGRRRLVRSKINNDKRTISRRLDVTENPESFRNIVRKIEIIICSLNNRVNINNTHKKHFVGEIHKRGILFILLLL